MDLDTSAKKQNKKIIRMICFFMALILFGGAVAFGINVLSAVKNFGAEIISNSSFSKNVSMYDSEEFNGSFNYDMVLLFNKAINENNVVGELKAQKAEIAAQALNDFKTKKARYIKKYFIKYAGSESSYNEDKFNTAAIFDLPTKSVRQIVTVDSEAPIFIRQMQTIINGTTDIGFLKYSNLILSDKLFSFKYDIATSAFTDTFYLELRYDDQDVKSVISNTYDSFVSDNNNYYNNSGDLEKHPSFKYYVLNKNTKKVVTNLKKGVSPEYFKGLEHYFSFINGKTVQVGMTLENVENYFNNNFDVYIAVNDLVNDDYSVMDKNAKSINEQNFVVQLYLSIALCLIALALSVIALALTDGILIFIDKIYTDIHFIISIGLAILIGLSVYGLIDASLNKIIEGLPLPVIMIITGVIVAIGYAIIYEFISSLLRICKSPKKLTDNILTFVIIKTVFKKIHILISNIKNLLVYREGEISRRTKPLLILIVIINSFLVFLSLAMSGTLKAIFFLIFVGFNVYVLIKWLSYVQNLDKIIVSAKRRTELEVSLDKLPKSLDTLAYSLKYTNNELQIAVEKAVKDERLKTELITNVSHDLKTPLTSIITYVDLLSKSDINDPNAKEYIKVLGEKSDKLKRLIEDLIEASKVSSGNITLNMQNLDLSELVTQACGECFDDFKNNNLELVVKPTSSPVIIFADGNKTFRVIENLLSNAKKYSASYSRIYASVYNDSKNGIFEIKNVSAEPLDITPAELTERFVRGDKSRNKSGNGLGLSIAKELCVAMGGRLEISIDGDLFKVMVVLPKK